MRVVALVLVAAMLCSCARPKESNNEKASNQGGKANAQADGKQDDQGRGAAADNAPQRGKGIIGKTTQEIVDLQKALAENPRLRIAERKVSAKDPLTQAGSVYQSAAAFAGSLPLIQWIKQEEVLNGRYPSHAELVAWMKKNGVTLPRLAPNRIYAYDARKGEIVVLVEEKP